MMNKPANVLDREPTPIDDLASRYVHRRVAEALRSGRCPDRAFDRVLPDELRVVSGQYWTPVSVARRAAEWLDDLNVRTVVDIGSGAGKFCVAAALVGHCHFTGLEQLSWLVSAARVLARAFEVDDRVTFVEGAFTDIATPVADAYYLFNPFGKYCFGSRGELDKEVEFSAKRCARDIAAVQDLLQRARIGTCVLTYNGFGGRVPASYRQIGVDRNMLGALRLWRKERSKPTMLGAAGRQGL